MARSRLVLMILALSVPYGAARPAAACPPSFPPHLEISRQLVQPDPRLSLNLDRAGSEGPYRLVAVTKGALSGSALRVVLGTKALALTRRPEPPILLGELDPTLRVSDAILSGSEDDLERRPLELRAYAGKRLVFHAVVNLIPGIVHRCVVNPDRAATREPAAPKPTPAPSAAPTAAPSATSSWFGCSR